MITAAKPCHKLLTGGASPIVRSWRWEMYFCDKKNLLTMKMIRTTIFPSTARQAFKILDGLTNPEEKSDFLSQTKSEFVGSQHFGLGSWIRNNWIYGREKETEEEIKSRQECLDMLTAAQHGDPIIADPDWVSSDFLGRYYDHLKRAASQY